MKQKNIIFLSLFLISLAVIGQAQQTSENVIKKIEIFKNKEKFIKDDKLQYAGVGNPKLKPILTAKINLSADDFIELFKKRTATDKSYQQAIKKGLDRFSDVYAQVDSEDRERVCLYYEELMDIVGLESSGGHLNIFMYGFDPTKKL